MTDTLRTRVFLLDDHEIVRAGLREMLEASGDIMVVGEAANAAEALPRIRGCQPQVAMVTSTHAIAPARVTRRQ